MMNLINAFIFHLPVYFLQMFIVGLTGSIATGKSTVSNYLVELGCAVIDADKLAKEGMIIMYKTRSLWFTRWHH